MGVRRGAPALGPPVVFVYHLVLVVNSLSVLSSPLQIYLSFLISWQYLMQSRR